MATAVDSGRGVVSDMTSMDEQPRRRHGERHRRRTSCGARAKTVDRGGECSARAMVSSVQWTREEAEMIDAVNDSSVVGRERGGEDDRPRRRRGELQCARRQRTQESSVRVIAVSVQ